MYETAYDIVAMGMRYFFLVLIAYILIRLVQHSVREFRAMQQVKKKVRSIAPGYLVALSPEEIAGERYALKQENTIGRGRWAEVRIELPSLALTHALIYEKKDGLHVADCGAQSGILLNGERIKKRREELLYTRDTLQLGEALLMLYLSGDEEEEEPAYEEME